MKSYESSNKDKNYGILIIHIRKDGDYFFSTNPDMPSNIGPRLALGMYVFKNIDIIHTRLGPGYSLKNSA
jgi:hypothetical protein